MGSAAEHTPSLGSWGLDLAYNSKLRSASHLSEINPLFSVMKLHFNHPKKLRESIADQCFDIDLDNAASEAFDSEENADDACNFMSSAVKSRTQITKS